MIRHTPQTAYRIAETAYLLIAATLLGWPVLVIAKLVQLSL